MTYFVEFADDMKNALMGKLYPVIGGEYFVGELGAPGGVSVWINGWGYQVTL